MQVLVAGGAGFLGSVVVHELSAAGLRPIIFDDFSTGHRQAVRGVDGIDGSLFQETDLRRLLSSYRFDAAVLTAGVPALEAEAPELVGDPHERYRRYFGGALELGRLLREYGVCPLVVASTLEVYGHSLTEPVTAAKPITPRPEDSTGRIALAVENLFLDCEQPGGLRPLILRFGWIAGAHVEAGLGDDRPRPSHWFARLVPQASPRTAPDALADDGEGEDPGDAEEQNDSNGAAWGRVDVLHVTDAARAVVAAVRSAAEGLTGIYDLGSESPATVESIISCFRELTGRAPPPLAAASAPPVRADSRRAREELGWQPERSDLRTILDDAIAWRRRYPDGYRSIDVYRARDEANQAKLFGEVAIRMGFITASDLIRALELQQGRLQEGQGHELLGLILLKEGMLNNIQLLEVLRYYEAERRRRGLPGEPVPSGAGLARRTLQRKSPPRRASLEKVPGEKCDKDRECD